MKFVILLVIVSAFGLKDKISYYDQELATEYAAYSFAAGCPLNAVLQWKVGYVSRNYPDIVDIQLFQSGFIGYNNKRQNIVVVFKEWESPYSWIDGGDFQFTTYNTECRCNVNHDIFGTYKLYSTFTAMPLNEYISKYVEHDVHIMGYGLGAAYATLYALDVALTGRPVLLYTFGSPRIGDVSFYNYFIKFPITHYRIVHNDDSIPHFPYHQKGYRHVGQEIWHHDTFWTECRKNMDEDYYCSYSVKSLKNSDHESYFMQESKVDC